jgi:hypothetical protein
MQLPELLARWGRLAFLGMLTACPAPDGGSSDDASDDPCIPGQSISCECDDGSQGARVCEPDGIGFGSCACEGSEAGTGSITTGVDGPGDDDPEGDGTDDDGPGGTTAGTGPDPDDDSSAETVAEVPDFQRDIVPILLASCGGGNPACHARNAYFPTADQDCRGWVSFEDVLLGSSFDDLDPATNGPPEGSIDCPDRSLHARLLELAPWECDASWRYVAPGSLDDSYIYRKLTEGDVCGDFRVMPPPGEGYAITQDQMDALAAWILAGAPP